jgi:hypothetical protein
MSDPTGILTLPRRAYALRHAAAPEAGRYAMHGIYRDAEAFWATDGTLLARLAEPGGPESPVWTARPTKALGKRVGEAQVPCGPVPGHYPPVLNVMPTAAHKHAELGGIDLAELRVAVDGASGWGWKGPEGSAAVVTLAWDGVDLVMTRAAPFGSRAKLRLAAPNVLLKAPLGMGELLPWSCDLARLDRLLCVAEESVPGVSAPDTRVRWSTNPDGTGAPLVLDVGGTLTLLLMPCVVLS